MGAGRLTGPVVLIGVFATIMLGGMTIMTTLINRTTTAAVDGLRGEMNGRIDGLRGELGGRIDGLQGEVNGRIDGLQGEIRGLRGEMNARFEAVDARFEAVEARFDARFTALDRDIAHALQARDRLNPHRDITSDVRRPS